MKIYKFPSKSEWPTLLARPVMDSSTLESKVMAVLQDVRANGDLALRNYTRQFDGVDLEQFAVGQEEITNAATMVSSELKNAIQQAAANIRQFHEAQQQVPEFIETMPGIRCWRKSVGIEKVGLYIPGGTAPLFSTLLMLGIPATLAGCREIILCSPPR